MNNVGKTFKSQDPVGPDPPAAIKEIARRRWRTAVITASTIIEICNRPMCEAVRRGVIWPIPIVFNLSKREKAYDTILNISSSI